VAEAPLSDCAAEISVPAMAADYLALASVDYGLGKGIRGAPIVPRHRPPLGQCGSARDQDTAAADSCPCHRN